MNIIEKQTDGFFKRLEEWSNLQDEKRAAYENSITEKFENLHGAINRKTEMDMTILSQHRSLTVRLAKIETVKEEEGKILAVVADRVKQMLEVFNKYDIATMYKDINVAHKRVGNVEIGLQNLKNRGGKLAAKIIYALGLAGGGALVGRVIVVIMAGGG